MQSFTLDPTAFYPHIRVATHNPWTWLCALLTAFLLLLPLGQAHASAIYQWKGAAGGGCCEVLLEITNEAYAAGVVQTHIQHTGAPQGLADSAVIRFQLTGYGDHIAFDRGNARGMYEFDLTITGDTVSGRIRVNDLSTDTLLSGENGVWAVKEHHADHPGDCFQAVNTCSGAQGRWILVSAPEQ